MEEVATLWNIAQCSPCVSRRFEGTYHLNIQGRKSAKQETGVSGDLAIASKPRHGTIMYFLCTRLYGVISQERTARSGKFPTGVT
jgi:hypothetical protein